MAPAGVSTTAPAHAGSAAAPTCPETFRGNPPIVPASGPALIGAAEPSVVPELTAPELATTEFTAAAGTATACATIRTAAVALRQYTPARPAAESTTRAHPALAAGGTGDLLRATSQVASRTTHYDATTPC